MFLTRVDAARSVSLYCRSCEGKMVNRGLGLVVVIIMGNTHAANVFAVGFGQECE